MGLEESIPQDIYNVCTFDNSQAQSQPGMQQFVNRQA
jgi:hypothetical protein